MISLTEALALLLDGVVPVESEQVPIGACGGRCLAQDIVAERDQPPSAMSAMDGYAVPDADAHEGAELSLVGTSSAGAPFEGAIEPGCAVRIATGGVVPVGADRVVIQEIVERNGERIRISGVPGSSSFVRPAGCDFAAGAVLARAGDVLTSAHVGLAASANLGEVAVRRRPRVVVIPSGDELREPGAELAPQLIVNSAAYAVAQLVSDWGAEAVRCPILPDDAAICRARIEQLDEADVLLPLGGASVGDRDILRHVFQELGTAMVFATVAVQPGKPCWHARFPDGRLVLGLPGNPASAFVCAHLLLRPLLAALTGQAPPNRMVRASLAVPMPVGADREVYWRARLEATGDGTLLVNPDARQDSSLLTPLASANALIRRMPQAPAVSAGAIVDVMMTGPLA